MTAKRFKRIRIALGILLGFFAILFAFGTSLLIANAATERYARALPSYAREDISALLTKEEWTDEDYRTIYLQTGVGRSAADAIKAQGNTATLLLHQDDLFYRGTIAHEYTVGTVTTLHDLLYESADDVTDERAGPAKYYARFVPLENGDVIVSSSCHTYGWRNGHAMLVTDAATQTVMESVALGMKSQISRSGARWFLTSSNFIVLRLKGATAEERAAIARNAEERLLGVNYSLTVGLFSRKDQCKDGRSPKETNCAHLVWQAYKNFGYDIDGNGGSVVTVRDIARCDLFEVVQVYGFDPEKLW